MANKVETILYEKSISTFLLDGDNVRLGLNCDLGFSPEARKENLRRIAEVGKLFVQSGSVTLAAFVSPLISDRNHIKSIIGEDDFIEIYIDTPLEVCEQRDVKGLYKKARRGEIIGFTGIDAPYESPLNPDLIIKTQNKSIDAAAYEIVKLISKKMNLNHEQVLS